MSELLTRAAQAMAIPEALADRSARARAAAEGVSIEDILGAWAGGQAAPTSSAPPPEEPKAAEVTPAAAEETPAAAEVAAPAASSVATPATAAAPTSVRRVPVPDRVDPREALDYPVVVSVPTAGIKERTNSALPRWLSTVFLIIPAFGLLYLAGALSGAGACEEGGINLAVDRQTGVAVNCDGSAFEGRGGGGDGIAEFLKLGQNGYISCAGCHGANGEGGVGPAFASLISTFGSCADNIEWVELGSLGFQAAGRDTYGDLGKPIVGGMPGFGTSISPEQLAAIVAFERIRYGGGDAAEVLTDCGLLEAGGEEGSGGTEARVGVSS